MVAIDHLVYVAPDLAAGRAAVEELLDARLDVGGAHTGRGTANVLGTFDADTYLEVIGIDPDQPEPDAGRPFGITPGMANRLATFAVHPTGDETIDDVAQRFGAAGFDPGPVVDMARTRPDGVELSWRLTFSATPVAAGVVPFIIDWGETPTPARSLPEVGSLTSLVVSHPDAAVRALVASLDSRISAHDGEPALVATIATASGDVELR